jgi:hypothetical protein
MAETRRFFEQGGRRVLPSSFLVLGKGETMQVLVWIFICLTLLNISANRWHIQGGLRVSA